MLLAVMAVLAVPGEPVKVTLDPQDVPAAEMVEPALENPLSMAFRLLVTLTAPPTDAW